MNIHHDSHVHFYDASDPARVVTQRTYALPNDPKNGIGSYLFGFDLLLA